MNLRVRNEVAGHDQDNNYQFRKKDFAPRSRTAVRVHSREQVAWTGMDSGYEALSPRSMSAEGARTSV
jgi:hypothetical protein